MLGISDEEADKRFGFFLNPFQYGAPPHGGFAFGIDRLAAILAGEDNIREVIAFPKTQSGADPMTGSPLPVDQGILTQLGIRSCPAARVAARGPRTINHRICMSNRLLRRLSGAALTVTLGSVCPSSTMLAPSVDAACTIGTTLRIGSRGDAVRCLQSAVAAAGHAVGPIDGAFGPVTHRGVVAYQRATGLVVDGVVGRQTAGVLGIWGRAAARRRR